MEELPSDNANNENINLVWLLWLVDMRITVYSFTILLIDLLFLSPACFCCGVSFKFVCYSSTPIGFLQLLWVHNGDLSQIHHCCEERVCSETEENFNGCSCWCMYPMSQLGLGKSWTSSICFEVFLCWASLMLVSQQTSQFTDPFAQSSMEQCLIWDH